MSQTGDAGQRMRGSRSSVAAGSQKSQSHSQARMASKRAATDDARPCAAAPPAQAKKRPALASLSNSSNVPATRETVSKAPPNIGAAKIKSRKSDTAQSLKPESIEPAQTDENRSAEDFQSPVVKANPVEVASLERRTLKSLCITEEKTSELAEEVLVSDVSYKDIDTGTKDPQMCTMYATDIYQHLRMTELKRRPTTNFMEVLQQDVNPSMRGILVDWLVEVAEEYKLVPDTLYLTVSYIDRFLSANLVNRQRLQLLGVACMLIAAKYEEISAPQVEEFCYITDNTYSKEELVDMEKQVLNYLRFELTTPTVKTFIRRFMRAAQASYKAPSLKLEFLGNYLAELSLVEYSFLKYMPSMIAASAVFLARLTLGPVAKPWNATLQHYTGYKASEIAECVADMYDLQRNTKSCALPAVREKYRQHKFKCVANLQPPISLLPQHFEDDDM